MKHTNRKAIIIDAINSELSNMYHNATPKWTDDIDGVKSFYDFVQQQAEWDIDWLDNCAYVGSDKSYTTYPHIQEEANKFKTEQAKRYFLRMKHKEYLRDSDCIECRIHQYGDIGCYGRGGRTCAPVSWIKGYNNNIIQYDYDDLNMEKATELLKDVTEWNQWVKSWNESIGEVYNDYAKDELEQQAGNLKESIHNINKKALKLIKEVKQYKKSFSESICEVITNKIQSLVNDRQNELTEYFKTLNTIKELA
jgi:hypothetical protein